ncbi:Fanconi anemia group J protein-like protein [Drosera capensis]
MKPTAPPRSPNPPNPRNPRRSSNVHHIGGIPVEFPYQPYGTQLAFMARVISTLDRAQREGHCHALLESPTGTGKSLSLLCSALAWQKYRGVSSVKNGAANCKVDPRARSDPLNHGGGFVPESQPPGTVAQEPTTSSTGKGKPKKTLPTIFYASRTHSQISQVIREYRKTTYRVPMSVLASRKHYCTNPHLQGIENIDEECKLLLDDREGLCSEFKNANKVKNHPSLQKGGCNEVHDIEDLVKVGQTVKGCSYFAARSMAEDADLVFCPYSYIISPTIRRAMEVDIKGAVIILDEAHNIEDMAREAGSVEVDEESLLRQKAVRELEEANISQNCFPTLQECAVKAIKAASDAESELVHLSGRSAIVLEGLFSSLGFFFHGNGVHFNDYQLALQRSVKRDAGDLSAPWVLTLSLWCLHPAVVFREIADHSLSVILTSGTLSPMHSFSSELGIQFGTCLEAPHVIDAESQVLATVISKGPGDYPLNASYKTADAYAFQDAVGQILEEISMIVPSGCLVFFPSYKLLDKLRHRWSETGQWSRLNARKSLFVETRGGSPNEFEQVLKGNDVQVAQKKKFNDTHRHSKNLISGSDWYCQQAFRALNQAAGRCIRHKSDYGAIIFLDERFREERNTVYISKWLRKSIRQHDNYETSLAELRSFFKNVKDRVGNMNIQLSSDIKSEGVPPENCVKGSLRKKNQRLSLSEADERAFNSVSNQGVSQCQGLNMKDCTTFSLSESQGNDFEASAGLQVDNVSHYIEIIDLEDNVAEDFRYSDACCFEASCEDTQVSVVKETPGLYDSQGHSPGSSSKDENSGSNVFHSPTEFQDSKLLHTVSSVTFPCMKTCTFAETPRSNISRNTNQMPLGTDLPQVMTANSYAQKRRKPLHSSLSTLDHAKCEQLLVEKYHPTQLMRSFTDFKTDTHRLGYGLKTSPSSYKSENLNVLGHSMMAGDSEPCFDAGALHDQRLPIYCSICSSPLGLPENQFYVSCSSTSLAKAALTSIFKKHVQNSAGTLSAAVELLVADPASVNKLLCSRSHIDTPGQGIWNKDDGCVYDTIFCPFCSPPNSSCLGVQAMATDASNAPMLNKDSPRGNCVLDLNSIEKYAYISQRQSSGGWRTTNTKLRLPKRPILRDTEEG